MSIKQRMVEYKLLRIPETIDSYGFLSTEPEEIADIMVSISKNSFEVSNTNPIYTLYEYVGITKETNIIEGDILEKNNIKYQVKKIGNSTKNYSTLFMDLWQR